MQHIDRSTAPSWSLPFSLLPRDHMCRLNSLVHEPRCWGTARSRMGSGSCRRGCFRHQANTNNMEYVLVILVIFPSLGFVDSVSSHIVGGSVVWLSYVTDVILQCYDGAQLAKVLTFDDEVPRFWSNRVGDWVDHMTDELYVEWKVKVYVDPFFVCHSK